MAVALLGTAIPPAIATTSASPAAAAQGAPQWSDVAFRDVCRALWWYLNGNLTYFESNATSHEAAMTLITNRYTELGAVPSNLTPEEQDELRQALSDAEAMLRDGPSTLNQTIVNNFLKSVSAMWIDLGGYPGDIGK